jgi:hypothetical protein
MLAAYLRGLLKPSMAFGFRSLLFEDVILEAMTADIAAENFRLSVASDSALASILTDEGKRGVLRRTQRQIKRHAALQLLDIYDLANGKRDKQTAGISLLQLFHLMKKEGIIHPDAAPTTTETE